ncbi:small ubiquitin-related modifier 3 isoform X1 [Ictidomys tridecemlineatus]
MSEEKPKEGVKTENDHINLKVAGQDGSVVQFKIKRHTPLSKLMKAYCERQLPEAAKLHCSPVCPVAEKQSCLAHECFCPQPPSHSPSGRGWVIALLPAALHVAFLPLPSWPPDLCVHGDFVKGAAVVLAAQKLCLASGWNGEGGSGRRRMSESRFQGGRWHR